jgi:adenylate kinase family enzyme
MTTLPILFLGPVRAGKTTLARLVASRLNFQHISLDEIRWKYYSEIGYDEDLAKQIRLKGGVLALMFYRQLFDSYSVERVLADYPEAVIDFGAGVGPFENQEQLNRIRSLFEPIPNVFLLLPSPDIVETLQILKQRDINPPSDLHFDINAHFIGHPGYSLLAKYIIYTKNKTPDQSSSEELKLLK